MEPEDEIRRRRPEPVTRLIDRFSDGKIEIALAELTASTGETRTIIQMKQTLNAGTRTERRQMFAMPLEDFGVIVEKAMAAVGEQGGRAETRRPARDTGMPRKIADLSEGRTNGTLMERRVRQGEGQTLLFLSDSAREFIGDFKQLAGIYKAARAIERTQTRSQEESPSQQRVETSLQMPARSMESSPAQLPMQATSEAPGGRWLAVVLLEGLLDKTGKALARVFKVFPESKREEAQTFADKDPRFVLWPETSPRKLEEGKDMLVVTKAGMVRQDADLAKMERQLRNVESKKAVETNDYLIAVWDEKHRRPEPGTRVTWDSGVDYRGEPQDYRARPAGSGSAGGADDPPNYVLIRKDTDIASRETYHVIERSFDTREEAIEGFNQGVAKDLGNGQERTLKPWDQEVTGMRRKF